MAKIQLFMLSVLLAVLLVMVDSEPLPEVENVANKGETPNIGAKANARPGPQHSAVSMNQAQIWTSFASIIAVWLCK